MTTAPLRSTMVAALPATAAVFVFGVIYGGVAGPVMGAFEAMLGSLLIFSGSVQFTIVALLDAGAGAVAVVVGAAALNLRNLVLGAVIRPRLEQPAAKRAALGWFLTDEAAGLTLATGGDASRILLMSGLLLYSAWQIGTAVGVAGASIDALSDAAAAVFPVLFVGLAAAVCTSRSIAVRAVVAAAVVALASWSAPGSEAVVAVLVAVAVAVPGRGS